MQINQSSITVPLTVASGWNPNGETQKVLFDILKTSADPMKQQSVVQAMANFQVLPDADYYLADAMMNLSLGEQMCSMAGLVLKNRLKRDQIDQSFLEYLRVNNRLLSIFANYQIGNLLKATIGTILATIISTNGPDSWPSLLEDLLKMHQLEWSMSAIEKICEDAADIINESTAISLLIPSLLTLLEDPSSPHKKEIIGSLTQFIMFPNEVFDPIRFVNGLSSVASIRSKDVGISRAICQALNYLIDAYPEELQSSLPSISEYTLDIMKNQEDQEEAAMESGEFWISFIDKEFSQAIIIPILPKLIPILLKNMRIAEGDEEQSDNEEIKPRHYRHHENQEMYNQEDGELANEEESQDDNASELSDWNLRKVSAQILDLLSTVISQPQFLSVFISSVQPFLQSTTDWKCIEVGVLALGAVSVGCGSEMHQFLPSLMPFFMTIFNNPQNHILLRSVTCWTISRYASWLESNSKEMGISVFSILLGSIKSSNAKLQKASASAIHVFIQDAPEIVTHQLELFLTVIRDAIRTYSGNNLTIIFDIISSFASNMVEDTIKHSSTKIHQTIIPTIMEKWQMTSDEDFLIFPILEAICNLAIASGELFLPYLSILYTRVISRMEKILTLGSLKDGSKQNQVEEFDDYISMSLDLIGGLVNGISLQALAPVLVSTKPSLSSIITLTICHDNYEIKQSAFGLIGDCAKKGLFLSLLKDCAPFILQALREGMNPESFEPDNNFLPSNAVWAFGEIAHRDSEVVRPFIKDFLNDLLKYLTLPKEKSFRNYFANVSVALGRALAIQPVDQGFLMSVIPQWCSYINIVKDHEELESAFPAIIKFLIESDESINTEILFRMCESINKYDCKVSQVLESLFKQLINKWKMMAGAEQWKTFRQQTLNVIPAKFDQRFD